ncbi:MAG TPA: C1 family peptidase [Phycisphaerales bacterium]|nr:C1 family peptidase [Phycisphaerales bacterium]
MGLEPISPLFIDDDTPSDLLYPATHATGLELARPFAGPAYEGVAEPFPTSLLIPRSEWQARIEERKRLKITCRDLCKAAGLPPKDQQRTNYCWINAPTYCCEVVRVMQNQPLVILSPASAGAQIKNYRNVGGWGKEGVEWISEHGLAPVDRWPANAIDRRYATPENQALALNYRIDRWAELEPNNLDQLVSAVLRGHPVAIGLAWWRHEVTAVDADWVDGEAVVVIRNSWGQWGDDGYGTLRGRKALPDDAVSPLSMLAA